MTQNLITGRGVLKIYQLALAKMNIKIRKWNIRTLVTERNFMSVVKQLIISPAHKEEKYEITNFKYVGIPINSQLNCKKTQNSLHILF